MSKVNYKNILILSVLSLFFSCAASFSKKDFKNEYVELTKNTLTKINGNYKLHPIRKFGKSTTLQHPDSLKKYINLYQDIVNENWTKKVPFDSLRINNNEYYINLELKNNSKLNISLFKNNILIKDTIITGKLKKGMFYLNNNIYKIDGIPYLAGGSRSEKRRIGISKNNSLIVNETVDQSGAFLFILWGGYSYEMSFEYERLK